MIINSGILPKLIFQLSRIKMLIRNIFFIASFITIHTVSAQSGIYYAEDNFKNRLTNYQIPCPKELSPEELYDFYTKKYILLSNAEAHQKIQKKRYLGIQGLSGIQL